MITQTQVVVPLASIGPLDDRSFKLGAPDEWIAAFALQVRASRVTGTLCRARVFVARNVAVRMFGEQALVDFGPWNSPMQLVATGPESERVMVFADVEMADDCVRIE